MERFNQFRDKGSGVSPFLPVTTPGSFVLQVLCFCFRLPLLAGYIPLYFFVLRHLPLPIFGRKLLLWLMMGIPGIWWADLQMDGVRRGTLSEQPRERMPHPGSVIAANFTSPIDAIYLAAVWNPIFTVSYPGTRRVERISLLRAVMQALAPVRLEPPPGAVLTDIKALLEEHPNRVIAVFPECGTTNGKAILPLSPSLLCCPPDAPIFPVSIRYSPGDVTTPVPGLWPKFAWDLLSRTTICIRIRIADAVTTHVAAGSSSGVSNGSVSARTAPSSRADAEEQKVLDKVADTLARLGRIKRVGLTLEDKVAFVGFWHEKK